jgi:hypothetical protein
MQIVYSTLGIFQEGWSVVCGLLTRYPSSQIINTISHFKVPLPRILKKNCSIKSKFEVKKLNLDLDILLLFCV